MSIFIEKYSEKSIAVFGETQSHKDKLKELGGKFNSNLRGKAGWIFPLNCEAKVKEYLTHTSFDNSSSTKADCDDFDGDVVEEEIQPKRLLKNRTQGLTRVATQGLTQVATQNVPRTQISLEAIMAKLEQMEKVQAEILALLKSE